MRCAGRVLSWPSRVRSAASAPLQQPPDNAYSCVSRRLRHSPGPCPAMADFGAKAAQRIPCRPASGRRGPGECLSRQDRTRTYPCHSQRSTELPGGCIACAAYRMGDGTQGKLHRTNRLQPGVRDVLWTQLTLAHYSRTLQQLRRDDPLGENRPSFLNEAAVTVRRELRRSSCRFGTARRANRLC